MTYIVRVKDPDVRREVISKRADEAQKKGAVRREYKFRNGSDLPIIELPIGDVLYRLENYRTRDKQLTLAAKGAVTSNFFAPARREDPSVQQKQHEILLDLARSGSGETIKPIYDELARVAEQQAELTISADGVVVNGNRRLCAMRELLRGAEASRYSKFEHIQCAVLPASATEHEIRDLEIGLQMQPETKLPYEWTALGRAVRDLRIDGETDDQIATRVNRPIQEVRRAAKMIDAADMYLSEWLQKPDDFDKLDGTEQAFIQIATRNLGKNDNAIQREVTRKFDFFVVEHRNDLAESAYDLINTIENNPEAFLKGMAQETGIELRPEAILQPSSLKINFGDPSAPNAIDYGPLVSSLLTVRANSDLARETIKTIEVVCTNVAEQGRNRDKAALKFAQRAEKALGAVDLQTAAKSTYQDIDTALTKCLELAEKLRGEIAERNKKAS